MSEEPTHGARTIRASNDHGGGGGGKWLLGAVAALVLIGGGYAAWTTFGPSQNTNSDLASNDPYADASYATDPQRAGPLEDEDTFAEEPASDVAPAAPAPAPARRATAARAAAVPEETIGITPASYSTGADDDEIVVTARRPIWASTPSQRRLTAMYPQRMLDRGREGEASLHCIVQDRGALDCERVEETSSTFGSAAVRVARSFRHATTLADGSDATGTPVNLRVVFRIDDEERSRFASR